MDKFRKAMAVTRDDEASIATSSSRSMQKWGIPEQRRVSNEVTLLERLVWVKYQNKYWWPALLYQNYSELQSQLYDQLDMKMKAQIAMAVMREVQAEKHIRVARLLGRQELDIVEVTDGTYAEFYWQLPNVLPMACHKSLYTDPEVYVDFHRGLDQVEAIIRDVTKQSFNLMPQDGNNPSSWEQRAVEALNDSDRSTSAPKNNERSPKPKAMEVFEAKEREEAKAIIQESSGLFSGLDAIMEALTGCVPIEEEQKVDKKSSPPTEVLDAAATSPTLRAFAADNKKVVLPPRYEAAAGSGRRVSEYYNRAANNSNMMEARDPSNEFNRQRRTSYFKKRNGLNPLDPTEDNRSRTGSRDSRGSGSDKQGRRQSIELLPGLEPDDIVPGITNVWKNVQTYMQLTREGADMDSSVDKVSAELKKVKPSNKRYDYDIQVVDGDADDLSMSAVEIAPKESNKKFSRVKDMMKKVPLVPPRYNKNRNNPPAAYDKYDVSDTTVLSTTAIIDMDDSRYGEYIDPNATPVDADADGSIAHDQPPKSLYQHPESDDTLWGFLTCRATAEI